MANCVTTNLAQLQDKIKRDADGFRDEFETQVHRYKTSLELLQLYPDSDSQQVVELMIFLASTAHCYQTEMANFGAELIQMLDESGHNFSSKFRNEIVKALILLRGKSMVEPKGLYQCFFKLFRLKDKKLRESVHKFIVQDVRKINHNTKNHAINKSLQNFMYTMLQDQDVTASFKSLQVTEDLYKKNIWNDEKTVNVISAACFHKHQKVQSRAISFFLGQDQKEENGGNESSDDEDPDEKRQREKNEEKLPTARDLMVRFQTGKKTTRTKKRNQKKMKRITKRSNTALKRDIINFSAIDMLHDPQQFAEKLFKQLEGITGDFEVKLLHIRLISRVIGVHKLVLYNFYPYLHRFITPQQRDVTLILQSAAHSTHDLVPPEVIEETLRCIANNFITERNSGGVMAVGLNTVREIAQRNPLAIGEDLLQDLVQYKKHIDRGVTTAARGLIQLYRHEAPLKLHKKDRGKPTEAQRQIVPVSYGSSQALDHLKGAEILSMKESVETEEPENKEKELKNTWIDGEWKDVEQTIDDKIDEDDITEMMEKEEMREEKIGRDELLKQKEEKARDVVTNRILTSEEHQKIQHHQALKQVVDVRRNKTNDKITTQNSSNVVSLRSIEYTACKRKHDKESRLATVLAGREGREKYGRGHRQKLNPYASSTNKDKRKNKAFMMVKHKLAKKQSGRSYAEKKKALSESLKKQLKGYKH